MYPGERLNSSTHLIGTLLAIAGLVVLTAGDAFDKRAKQPATDVRRAKTATVRPLKKAA